MSNRIFKSILLVAAIVLLSTAAFIIDEMYQMYLSSRIELLESETRLIASGIDNYGFEFCDSIDKNEYRITIIDKDGTVLYDKGDPQIPSLDNLLEKQEVKDAINTGYGVSVNSSDSYTENFLYTAVLLKNGDIVRFASAHDSMLYVLTFLLEPMFVLGAILVAICFFIAYRLTRSIIKPLNKLDLDNPDVDNIYEEVKPMLNKLSTQKQELRNDEITLRQRKLEFEAIIQNMSEGMILMNADGDIVEFNATAGKILEMDRDMIGKNIREIKDYDKIADLFDTNNNATKNIKVDYITYTCEKSPVINDNEVSGYTLLLFDESYKEANDAIRRDFASNISHELKTPLQSISGYAELLKNGVVDKEKIQEFSEKIYEESQRMSNMIMDMIRLSKLESEQLTLENTRINLATLCKEIIDSIRITITNGVEIIEDLKDSYIYAKKELVESTIHNLVVNAINYNKDNGKVYVSVYNKDKKVYLVVKDTGIGIEQKDLNHIFEKFYVVDKARSKKIGGTGLGLSIVKHACILNNAKINVESKLNEGTTFTVEFTEN